MRLCLNMSIPKLSKTAIPDSISQGTNIFQYSNQSLILPNLKNIKITNYEHSFKADSKKYTSLRNSKEVSN